MSDVTIGLDIGTTSVKAVCADDDGNIVARARIPHTLRVPTPDQMEHDAAEAWRRGVLAAYGQMQGAAIADGHRVVATNVAAMVPSCTAVDEVGHPLTPGLLYGDARGRLADERAHGSAEQMRSGEMAGFVMWQREQVPDAHGYWPAQAVANRALGGEGVIDFSTAATTSPFFDYMKGAYNPEILARAGVDESRLPRICHSHEPAGRVLGTDVILGPGAVDAAAEQLVMGADHDGDVVVICGTTLIVWGVIPEWQEGPGVWTIPHSTSGKILVGGPSNAGGLFIDWARRTFGDGPSGRDAVADPSRVPVFMPYIRGERVPLHDPFRRAEIVGLDLTHDAAAIRRAAFEAAGMVTRHFLDLGGALAGAQRIVASGGGTRVEAWLQALADCTGLPVDVLAVPEGAALGSAFYARIAAGLEQMPSDGRRWARLSHRVEPDPRWVAACRERYAVFAARSGVSVG